MSVRKNDVSNSECYSDFLKTCFSVFWMLSDDVNHLLLSTVPGFSSAFLMNNVTHEGKKQTATSNKPSGKREKEGFFLFFLEFSLKSSFRVNSHHIRSRLQSTCHLLFVQALLKHKHTRTQPFLSLRLFHFLSLALHSRILLSNPILVNKMAGNIR